MHLDLALHIELILVHPQKIYRQELNPAINMTGSNTFKNWIRSELESKEVRLYQTDVQLDQDPQQSRLISKYVIKVEKNKTQVLPPVGTLHIYENCWKAYYMEGPQMLKGRNENIFLILAM